MKIASKTHVFQTLEKYNLIAKKGYGQNFLINEKITYQIANNNSIDKDSLIIEIGPGLGALTEELLLRFNKVIAIEIDKNMVNVLSDSFNNSNLEIINKDFLKVDLNEIINSNNDYNKISIVSNLPYYITSDILEKIILFKEKKIDKLVVMMQKEVGKKLLKKDEKIDSFLKFLIDIYCDVKELLYVSKNDFIPRPNIDSIVLELELNEAKYEILNVERLFFVIKESINNKRKFLLTTLSSTFNIDKKEVLNIYLKYNLKETIRLEEISSETFIEIVNEIIKLERV